GLPGPLTRIIFVLALAGACLFSTALSAKAQLAPLPGGVQAQGLPGPLRDVGIDQKLNAQIPSGLVFNEETGRQVALNQYFNGKPVILALVYYDCPMLCTQILNGLDRSINILSLDAGKDYGIVTVSINPKETPALAAAKKEVYLSRYRRAGAAEGWHFLTGDEKNIKALTEAVGFKYAYDPRTNLFAHASGIVLLTGSGRVSRYYFGIEYPPRDLRLGLIEASQNKIGTPIDKLLLFCYHYDPSTGKYSLTVLKVVRLAGIVTLALIGLLVLWMRRRYRHRSTPLASNIGAWPLALLPLFPESASTHAGKVDALYFFLCVVALFFTVAIFFFIIYFAVKYRRRATDEVGRKVIPDIRIEILWIVLPFILCMVIFVWGASLYFSLSAAPRDAQEVFVVGKQWMWKFQHVSGQREIDELHVPVNTDIKMVMTTEDVIHSFFVPAFRIKADVVPGRYSTTWFKATKPGKYHLFCAEYCGTNHSGMIGWVYVMEPADYEAWLSGGATEGSLATTGEKLFEKLGCSTCHKNNGQGRGPSLQGIFGKPVSLDSGLTVTADESYVRESILDPKAKVVAGYQPIMPTFQGIVTEEQVLQLVAYVKSLGGEQSAGAGTGAPSSGGAPLQAAPTAPRGTAAVPVPGPAPQTSPR
ncbi:MAG TPA: cytochrome c oxidase subunit II, partial [Blastocatellia bacterium]|nr:cytochrome c oxidase subunit II [Blastocatellia bacterium]